MLYGFSCFSQIFPPFSCFFPAEAWLWSVIRLGSGRDISRICRWKSEKCPGRFFLHKPCLPEACPNPVLSGLVVALAEIQGRLLALRLSFASDGCFFNRQPRLVVLDVCVESCDVFRSGGYFHTGVACKYAFVQIVGEIQFLRVVDEIGS